MDMLVIKKGPASAEPCTRGGTWTRTNIAAHRILSPACLPVPPPGQPEKLSTVWGPCHFLSERRDSNPRPRPWQGRALPAELLSHFLPHYFTNGSANIIGLIVSAQMILKIFLFSPQTLGCSAHFHQLFSLNSNFYPLSLDKISSCSNL